MATKRVNEEDVLLKDKTFKLAKIEEALSDNTEKIPINKLIKVFDKLTDAYNENTPIKEQARLTNEVYNTLFKNRR